MKKFGIKGFDKNLKCRDFQYKIGETYEIRHKPILCRIGFHYSKTINDVFKYYPLGKDNSKSRYCLVEIIGDVDDGVDKSATNKIRIIREIFEYDIKNSNITFEEISEMCEYGFIIGGSIALKLHGYKILRNTKEIDLIIKQNKYEKIKDNIFIGYKEIKRFSGMDSVKCYVDVMGNKFDILISEKINAVEREFGGYIIKLQDENVIWGEKLKYALNGSIKHMDDININNIRFIKAQSRKYPGKKFNPKEDLPF